MVSSSNSCYEELNATEGRVTLDTRIMYSPGGCCNCREDINIFTIRLGSPTNPTIFYNCDDTPDSDCPANERVVVNRQSTLFYDFKVELQLNESDIAQLIYVASEVRQPGRSDFRYFWKIFSVTVHQGELYTRTCTHAHTHTHTCTDSCCIPHILSGNRYYFLVLMWVCVNFNM